MTEEMQREFKLGREDAAELFRDIADALEERNQLNIDLGDSKVVQPLGGKIPLRIFQGEEGTELGFLLSTEDH